MLVPLIKLFFSVLVVALAVWWWAGLTEAALAALLVVLVCAVGVIWKTYRIERWLSESDLHTPLPWKGVWSEIAHRIQRLLRQRENQVTAAEQRLQYFLQAIQASPNGVTLLDAQGRIEWCNATASSHLGLDVSRDLKQHIVHLVRDPVFSKYFAVDQHDSEVVIDGRASSLVKTPKLSVQLHAYGEGQQLLLTRDITSVTLADAMRRDFVANVSHEIRTPLTVLGGFVETLQSIPLEADEQQRYLHLMAVQADRMQSLVADLLTLSQLEGSLPPGLYEKVNLPDLMGRVATDAAALSSVLSDQEGDERVPVHELIFEPVPHWSLLGVRSELLSAISNLVSNAVRYTPAGGQIRVAWSRTADGAIFSVSDTGLGIAPEHLPRLSERFYRVDRSRSRETGGTGLGLAIAKHVVQRHGGELRIQSQVGKGSTFMLVLPAGRIEPLSD
ncbi:phosphate regulon sensor histidine kinase PhoR [Limnohabitans parvus]|uniref:Phosphate regulon sensor protein PhoR n=1 Tax=Limnohabitans parvus II-B4 TaxID=1293052 RepID=A0A315E7X7_9BURK|nr:phosphate regulon sensor histidine kinase PhoR [Limnohabitans parvus]PUE53199.1 phosphate regulon sensor histidine kinase PhoR [Limnohabitans parvus II-B4]